MLSTVSISSPDAEFLDALDCGSLAAFWEILDETPF